MPRRNRNANAATADIDELAQQATQLAHELSQSERINAVPGWADSWHAEIVPVPPVCAACWINPATEGNYCALCKGQIIISARKTTVKRR